MTNMEHITNLVVTSLNCFSVQVLVFYLVLIAYLVQKSSKHQETKGILLPPGPPRWPVIGNLAGMRMNRPTWKWIHRVMDEMKTKIACFRFGSVHVISITSSEIAREALRDKGAIFADRPESYPAEFISGTYKDVLFSQYGEHQWRKMRKVMTSQLMSPTRLSMLHDARNVEADNLLAYVHHLYGQSKTVNVRDIVRTYCHAVMMRLMFGQRHFKEATKDGGLGLMEKEHVNAIFKAQDCLFGFCVSDYVSFLRGWNLEGDEKQVREAVNVISTYNNLIINDRIELWRERGEKKDVEDWIDVIITLKDTDGKPLLTPEEVRALCMDICIAMIDNPTNIVEWTLAEMLNRPEMFEKAIDELDNVVGKDRRVQESDIVNLNFIKSCCRESFRLHPIAPFLFPHVAREDTTLGGFFVPKGSHILVSRVGLGRNPKIWDEPDIFRPERHLGIDEVHLLESEMRFVSFSTGRRGCIGGTLGTSMTIMLLARLLQGFKWSLRLGKDQVELVESETSNLLMAEPLLACVEPRFGPHWYPELNN